jgi:hypothetical protein
VPFDHPDGTLTTIGTRTPGGRLDASRGTISAQEALLGSAGMRRWRRHAGILVVCAVVVAGGAIAALIVTHGGNQAAPRAATTGPLAPLTVKRPDVPVIGGGIPVDLDPVIEPKYFSTALTFLPGTHRYRITISNASSLGAINSFQWYPPTAVHILKLLGSTKGTCTLRSLTGFGGNQFPTVKLHPNVLCDNVDLKAPSCTCRGDGGAVTISFVTDKEFGTGDVDLRVRSATLVFHAIPVS